MNSSWHENLPSSRKKAMDELLRGQESAAQLKLVINQSIGFDESMFVEDLVKKVMNSFSSVLYILNGGESDEVASQIPLVGSPCWDDRKTSKDSGESTGKSAAELKVKDRRGCYKRRKSVHSRTYDSSTLTDDGHAWRKYGQKVILNAKYPRNYFRCTHKYDQQCQATKQVQKIQEEPQLFRTTYYGHHTCKNLLKASQFVSDPSDHDSSILISFNDSTGEHQVSKKPDNSLLATYQTVKQECCNREDSMSMPSYDPATYYNNQGSSSDYLLSPADHDYMSRFDSGDVISGVNSSCTTSSHSLDMDGIMIESGDFDDGVFGFDL
ncbi:hypothetical protein OIU78_001624 [Salix suchowensis]|nr:hypothetical protein OIU78_001624 [Salix suchowensis]